MVRHYVALYIFLLVYYRQSAATRLGLHLVAFIIAVDFSGIYIGCRANKVVRNHHREAILNILRFLKLWLRLVIKCSLKQAVKCVLFFSTVFLSYFS